MLRYKEGSYFMALWSWLHLVSINLGLDHCWLHRGWLRISRLPIWGWPKIGWRHHWYQGLRLWALVIYYDCLLAWAIVHIACLLPLLSTIAATKNNNDNQEYKDDQAYDDWDYNINFSLIVIVAWSVFLSVLREIVIRAITIIVAALVIAILNFAVLMTTHTFAKLV